MLAAAFFAAAAATFLAVALNLGRIAIPILGVLIFACVALWIDIHNRADRDDADDTWDPDWRWRS
jgi:hypothetical protein